MPTAVGSIDECDNKTNRTLRLDRQVSARAKIEKQSRPFTFRTSGFVVSCNGAARAISLLQMAQLPTILIWLIAVLSILGMLVRPMGIAEAWWACCGAFLLVIAGLLPVRRAGHAILEGLDVYLFLAGMMILAELAREEGVFDWIANIAAAHANGSPQRLFALVYLAGVIVTALLSNDATAVVLTPAVLAVVRRAKANAKPYLLACAFIANAASFIFPISNPANLVVFGAAMPSLAAWLRIFFAPAIVAIAVTFLGLRWLSRHELRGAIENNVAMVKLTAQAKPALCGLLISATVLTIASALGRSLGAPTCIAAIFTLMVVSSRNRGICLNVARGVSWSVLPLVAGLFVIVEALRNAGMLGLTLVGLQWLAQTSALLAKFTAAFAVALLSNGMNNLPVGLIGGMALRHSNNPGVIAHAILLGVDLGPNLSVTGSLATILWLIALRREKVEITAWEFFKIGIIVMPLALAAGLLVLSR
jgi:arsenical pump membrane protein